jgi:CRISPR/Cas system CMR subunit Cmr4 (Cas7 group RAMP superfamily)
MEMSSPEPRLLRLEVLTSANVGTAAGEASLDRPTQKEAWDGLPYLPDSALKGVFAGRFGDILDHQANPARERYFGSPDRPGQPDPWGRPASFVFGNAELLAFPLPSREGEWVWVFPALAVARCLRFTHAEGAQNGMKLLEVLEAGDSLRYFGWPHRSSQDALAGLTPVEGQVRAEHGPPLVSALHWLAGSCLLPKAPIVVVASSAAGRLWRLAAEHRTSTALETGSKTVRNGSLRRAELIPALSLFVSIVSSLGDAPDLSQPLPLGAWESLGFGWVRACWIETVPAATEAQHEEPDGISSQVGATEAMGHVWRSVENLRQAQPEAQLKSAIKAAVANFGPRATFGGLEAAIAFHAAKAKPARVEPSPEARAHRWVLAALTNEEVDPPPLKQKDERLLRWLNLRSWTSSDASDLTGEVMLRWHWLRRFTELGLDDIQPEGPGGGE